ncbi:MAG: PadR family transcriptional regulator [Alphaproteobacteria bacterium]
MDVRTVCLGVLTSGEASGYEIKKHLEDGPFSHFVEAGFGSIYPALNRLSRDGLVTCRTEEQTKRPDKKVYRLTPLGRLELIQALSQPPPPDRFRSDFLFMMHFAEHLPARLIENVIDARIAQYRACLHQMAQADHGAAAAGADFVAGFARAVYQAAVTFLEDNRYIAVRTALMAEKTAQGAEKEAAE